MPTYRWLYTNHTDLDALPSKMRVLRTLGVPYPKPDAATLRASALAQAQTIVDDLRKVGATTSPDREIVALIAYLQQLGQSEKVVRPPPTED